MGHSLQIYLPWRESLGKASAEPPRSLRKPAQLHIFRPLTRQMGHCWTGGQLASAEPPRSLSGASAGASAGSPSPNQSLAPPKAQLTQTKKNVFDVIKDRSSAARQMDTRVDFRHRITNNLVPFAANECPVSVWLFGVIQRRLKIILSPFSASLASNEYQFRSI